MELTQIKQRAIGNFRANFKVFMGIVVALSIVFVGGLGFILYDSLEHMTSSTQEATEADVPSNNAEPAASVVAREGPAPELTIPAVVLSRPPVDEEKIEGDWYPTDDNPLETYGFVEEVTPQASDDGSLGHALLTVTLADGRVLTLLPILRYVHSTGESHDWNFSTMETHRWNRITMGKIFDPKSAQSSWNVLFKPGYGPYTEVLAVMSMCSKGGRPCETYDEALAAWRAADGRKQLAEANKNRAGG